MLFILLIPAAGIMFIRKNLTPAKLFLSTGFLAMHSVRIERLLHLSWSDTSRQRWRWNSPCHPSLHRRHCSLQTTWDVGLDFGHFTQHRNPVGICPGTLSVVLHRAGCDACGSGTFYRLHLLPTGNALLFAEAKSKRKRRTILDVLSGN